MTNTLSEYARVFDRENLNWQDDPGYNLIFLKNVQHHCNDRLKRQKYLFLRDVYEILGFEVDKPSILVGWIYNEKNPIGDNYVDFKLYEKIDRDGKCEAFEIDFNVDGQIIDLIPIFKSEDSA